MTIDLRQLAEVDFVDTDATTIEQAVITTYEGIAGVTLYPGDPVRLFLEALAAIVIQQRMLINYTGKSNLLRYAAGDVLDHLGALTDTARLFASAAVVTMRFSVSSVLGFAVPIPAGTRATPDGRLIFATAVYGEIPAGALSVDIPALCVESGETGNGLLPGQISRLVDPLPYIAAAVNVTSSAGGSEIEDDESFRGRVQMSPEKFSTAGPEGAYRFWALSAHQDIVDVAVYSPAPGKVELYPLCDGGVIPDGTMLDLVAQCVNDVKVRPLTDQLQVLAPTAVSYGVAITYWIATENATLAAAIQSAVSSAVSGWLAWQRERLGRDINPSELISRVQSAGAKRVEVASPLFTVVEYNGVAQEGAVVITYGGLEHG